MICFVDAGGWISVLAKNDQYHAIAKVHWELLIKSRARLVTTDHVLDEVITRLRYDVGHRAAVQFLDLVVQAEGSGVLRVLRIDTTLWSAAQVLFRRFDGPRLSFTDCTSFAALHEHPVDEVFGYDAHFEMLGFVLQPKR